MLDFLKKQRVSFYFSALAALFAVIGVIMLIVTNTVGGYAVPYGGLLIFTGILSVLLIGGGAYAISRFGAKPIIIFAIFLALVLMMLAVGILLRYRLDVASALFTWDPENEVAWKAFNTGVVCVVFYLIASITLTISAFLKQGPKKIS